MVNISAQRVLNTWERGALLSAEAKSQALLSLISPDLSTQALTDLVLGERNKNLLELRQQLFGSKLQAYIECGECGEALDLEFSIDDFGFSSIDHIPEMHSVSIENMCADIRLPNGHDLTALTQVKNVEDGRQLLFSRCVLKLLRNGVPMTLDELNDVEMNQLEEAIAALDPRMEILFDLSCPECSHSWQSPLDIGAFLWREFDVYALQLLENIHLLASTYGWSETDILAMSHVRRNHYVERLLQ